MYAIYMYVIYIYIYIYVCNIYVCNIYVCNIYVWNIYLCNIYVCNIYIYIYICTRLVQTCTSNHHRNHHRVFVVPTTKFPGPCPACGRKVSVVCGWISCGGGVPGNSHPGPNRPVTIGEPNRSRLPCGVSPVAKSKFLYYAQCLNH